ncbi:MAG: glycosyltransferase family 4 protein [Myxococcota bacterium]
MARDPPGLARAAPTAHDARAMRLLFVSHSFPPLGAPLDNVGGMQRVATELHDALSTRDDVALRTLALRSSWKDVHKKAVPFLVGLVPRLLLEARRHRADTVLFTSMTTALPALFAGPALQRQGLRVGAIAHGLDVTETNPAYQAAIGRLCRSLDVFLPVSRATRQQLIERGAPPERVIVVPNAVDVDRFAGPTDGVINGAPPLADDAFLLVTVGRQVKRKGFAWFVEHVMPRLPERAVFWLAGDGPERGAIEAAIARAGLEARVRCLGKIDEPSLLALYRRGALFLMPNVVVPGDMEGFGIVMLEAGVTGLPTVAADLEGIRDVITEGVNGWFAPTGDAEAFATRIRGLMADPDALAAARERTRAHVNATFTWDATAERTLAALRGA